MHFAQLAVSLSVWLSECVARMECRMQGGMIRSQVGYPFPVAVVAFNKSKSVCLSISLFLSLSDYLSVCCPNGLQHEGTHAQTPGQ